MLKFGDDFYALSKTMFCQYKAWSYSGIGQAIRMRSNPYLPSDAYRAIKQNNQKGYEIKIK